MRPVLMLCLLPLAACEIVEPGQDAGLGKVPGDPFDRNICFNCTLRACAQSASACTMDLYCSPWLNCVAKCPTDESGVAADGACIRRCGLPVSAEFLFVCIQDYSTGNLLGCEQACAPLDLSDGGPG